jgi:23S rRNA pseudouridine1911/1915/1917 synthase
VRPRARPAPSERARRVLRHVVDRAEAGRRLDHVLGERLSGALRRPVSKAALRRAIMAGAVRVDGRVLRRPGFALAAGARLVAGVELEHPAGARVAEAPLRVLYEDAWLIAVDKPPGLPLHATADPSRPHLVGAVQAYLAASCPTDARPYLGVHQRLDRDTSGVVLFTKDPAANAGLAEQFTRHAVEKTYVALTRRPARLPPPRWTIEDTLARVGRGRMGRVPAGAGGRSARTDFRLIEALPTRLRIEARPRTGRQHQIRVHLAEAGLPIVGDAVYGGDGREAPRVMLHATRLRLRHPLTGVTLTLECPPPPEFTRRPK